MKKLEFEANLILLLAEKVRRNKRMVKEKGEHDAINLEESLISKSGLEEGERRSNWAVEGAEKLDNYFKGVENINLNLRQISFQDLDELHDDVLDEKEEREERGCLSCFLSKKSKTPTSEWLNHLKIVSKNSRFNQSKWSGNLYDQVNKRFSSYDEIQQEQMALHQNVQSSMQELVRNSFILQSSKESQLENSIQQNESAPLKVASNQAETSKNVRESVKAGSRTRRKGPKKVSLLGRPLSFLEMKQKRKGSSVSFVWNPDPENQVEIDPKLRNIIDNSEILEEEVKSLREDLLQDNFMDMHESQVDERGCSQIRQSFWWAHETSEEIKKNEGDHDEEIKDSQIKANTLLIDSRELEKKDNDLYQAAVYYKSITLYIEEHLKKDTEDSTSKERSSGNQNNYKNESQEREGKPLRAVRDQFVEYFGQTYGSKLQNLTTDQMTQSIRDLKSFILLFLEVIREYYKLDELVGKCVYADRFMTSDNLVNFLSALLFQDDAIYSVVYIVHCHFETSLALSFFKASKGLEDIIDLSLLKVSNEYTLDAKTLQKQDGSINNVLRIPPPYEKAYLYFRNITHQRSPVHKLKVLIQTQELLNQNIIDFYQRYGLDSNKISYDADNLIGIFCYIILKSKVYDIVAHLKIIEHFATKNTLNSQSGYLLVTLQCCIRFISEINVPLLLNSDKLDPLSSQQQSNISGL